MRIKIRYRYKTDDSFDIEKTLEKYEYVFKISGFSTNTSDKILYYKYRDNLMPTRKELLENDFRALKTGSIKFELKENTLYVNWLININVSVFRSIIFGLLGALIYYFYIKDVVLNSILLFSCIWLIVFIVSLILIKLKTLYFNHSVL